MKVLILAAATFFLSIISSTSNGFANEAVCSGDAAHAEPPVVNNPTHIRNVIWRNTRAMCLQQMAVIKASQAATAKVETVPMKRSEVPAVVGTEALPKRQP